MKLALISFDGLDPRIIYDNPVELPTMHKFMNNAVHGKWRTPGHTIPSYIQTLTGLQYNQTDFYWDITNGGFGRHRQTGFDFIWDITDINMTLLNMPVLYPPEEIDDAMVCGLLTPDGVSDRNIAKPNDVQKMLNDMNYVADIDAEKYYEKYGGEMPTYLSGIMNKRVDVAEKLINQYDSDLFYGVWTMTDRWFHMAGKYDHSYLQMYRYSDDILLEILNIIPKDVPLLIFSDHGFSHYPNDPGVQKGHMYEGWYAFRHPEVPPHRDDSANIQDVFPTVLNYFNEDIPDYSKGRIMFHNEEQDQEVIDRLNGLGYLE